MRVYLKRQSNINKTTNNIAYRVASAVTAMSVSTFFVLQFGVKRDSTLMAMP